MSIQEINAAAKDLIDIRAMIAELEAQAEALTDKLKGAMEIGRASCRERVSFGV